MAEAHGGSAADGDYLVVARVVAPHGVWGEVKCQVLTDFPERLRAGRRVFVGEPPRPMTLRAARHVPSAIYLSLDAVGDRESAESLRGLLIRVPVAEAAPLPDGHFFWHQVIGLQVEDEQGTPLGRVADILETGASHVYVVRGPGGETLVPAQKEFVTAIEPDRGRLVVRLLPGMRPSSPPARVRRPRRSSGRR